MSKNLTKIRVGGVPEHFNYPFHIGMERGFFLKHGIDVEWTDIGKGTGAMVSFYDDHYYYRLFLYLEFSSFLQVRCR